MKNLLEIQSYILEKFPLSELTATGGIMKYPDQKIFFDCKELVDSLTELDILDHISPLGIAIHVTCSGGSIPIHIDSGEYDYSLNIPIVGCENTFLNFFSTDKSPELKYTSKLLPYYVYDIENCSCISHNELTTPYILNTKIPHNVENKSKNTRVTLLVRLARTINGRFNF